MGLDSDWVSSWAGSWVVSVETLALPRYVTHFVNQFHEEDARLERSVDAHAFRNIVSCQVKKLKMNGKGAENRQQDLTNEQ